MGQVEDLRLFALIVDRGSISAAAEQLNIAKSAVSRRLRLLEERLDTRLIERTPGVWEVTHSGRELYQRAVPLVGEVEELLSDFGSESGSLRGVLRVSMPRDFGLAFLTPALLAFKNSYPEIRLMVDFDDRQVDLSREDYDFALRISPSLAEGLVAERVGTSLHHLCASPSYLKDRGRPAQIADLEEHALLMYSSPGRSRWRLIDGAGKQHDLVFQPALNSNSGEFLLRAAREGLGITRLPDFLCAPALEAGELVPVLPELSEPEWGIYLAHSEHRRLNRRMRLFADFVAAHCQAES